MHWKQSILPSQVFIQNIFVVPVELTQAAAREKFQKRQSEPPDIDEWLAKRLKSDKNTEKTPSSTYDELPKLEVPLLPKYELPSFLRGISNLPPSVLPPSQDCLQGLDIDGWG